MYAYWKGVCMHTAKALELIYLCIYFVYDEVRMDSSSAAVTGDERREERGEESLSSR